MSRCGAWVSENRYPVLSLSEVLSILCFFLSTWRLNCKSDALVLETCVLLALPLQP